MSQSSSSSFSPERGPARRGRRRPSDPSAPRSPAEGARSPLDLPPEAAALAVALPQHAPSPGVKAALLARIAASRRPPLAAGEVTGDPGWHFASLDDPAGWLVLPFPGVRMKAAVTDPSLDTVFVLVDMAPGARIPDHPHEKPEFGLVISGDVTTGGRLLRAGDCYISDAGVQHREIVSPSGCRGLITLRRGFWDQLRSRSRSA